VQRQGLLLRLFTDPVFLLLSPHVHNSNSHRHRVLSRFQACFSDILLCKGACFYFLPFIRAKDSNQEITFNTQRVAAFQYIKFSILKAVQDERFTCAEAPSEHFSKLGLEVCR